MFLDLTMPLNPSTPVFPGDPHVEIEPANQFTNSGCLDHRLRLGTHSGTHIDAPGHMIEGGAMLDAYAPDRFIGSGQLVALGDDGEADLSKVEPGDIVLLRTGMSSDFRADGYYDRIPPISVETAHALVSIGVKMVGVDAGSVDASPFVIHKTLLGGDVLIIENLVDLSRLEAVAAFEVLALPLRLEVEAAPARVLARV